MTKNDYNTSMHDVITNAYYDPRTGFVGVEKLFKTLHESHPKITRKDIKEVLDKQEIVQTSRKNVGKQGSFVPPYAKYEYQIDLIYLDDKHLNQAKYGLVCIDTFSKIGDIELMKLKNDVSVVNAMTVILARMGVPEFVYSDEGSEFTCNKFKKLMSDNKIQIIYSLSHAPMVERLNRTIKEMLAKYLQSTNTKTITNALPMILHNYNNSYHKTIKMKPVDVTFENEEVVYQNILNAATVKNRPKIDIGDDVRVRIKERGFVKGYKPKFSKTIHKVIEKQGRYYIIDGLDRKYMRAYIQKVGEVEYNIREAELENTNEGRLKEMSKNIIKRTDSEIEELMNKGKTENSVALTKTKRVITKPKKFD
jgi:NCAIR mutase (PurE)-related protein